MKTLFSLLIVMIVLVSCQSNDTAEIPEVIPQASEPDYEVMSLLGEPLNPPGIALFPFVNSMKQSLILKKLNH